MIKPFVEAKVIEPISKWVSIVTATVVYPAPEPHLRVARPWWYVTRKPNNPERTDAVHISVLVREKGEDSVLLIKIYRPPFDDYVYELPAGLIENGEDPVETAKRELLEETGYKLTYVFQVSPPVCASSGITDETSVIVTGMAEPCADATPEPGEFIEVVKLPVADVHKFLKTPGLKMSAKAYMSLLKYA